MRKTPFDPAPPSVSPSGQAWLDVERMALVEAYLRLQCGGSWRYPRFDYEGFWFSVVSVARILVGRLVRQR